MNSHENSDLNPVAGTEPSQNGPTESLGSAAQPPAGQTPEESQDRVDAPIEEEIANLRWLVQFLAESHEAPVAGGGINDEEALVMDQRFSTPELAPELSSVAEQAPVAERAPVVEQDPSADWEQFIIWEPDSEAPSNVAELPVVAEQPVVAGRPLGQLPDMEQPPAAVRLGDAALQTGWTAGLLAYPPLPYNPAANAGFMAPGVALPAVPQPSSLPVFAGLPVLGPGGPALPGFGYDFVDHRSMMPPTRPSKRARRSLAEPAGASGSRPRRSRHQGWQPPEPPTVLYDSQAWYYNGQRIPFNGGDGAPAARDQ